MKTIRRLTAIALVATLTLTSAPPARSNAIVVGDLILVGTVVTAGVLYYVWQNQKTHKKIYTIEDPEEEMERMGRNAQNGRTIRAKSASEAHSICSKYAGLHRKTATPQNLGNNRWLCRYYY